MCAMPVALNARSRGACTHGNACTSGVAVNTNVRPSPAEPWCGSSVANANAPNKGARAPWARTSSNTGSAALHRENSRSNPHPCCSVVYMRRRQCSLRVAGMGSVLSQAGAGRLGGPNRMPTAPSLAAVTMPRNPRLVVAVAIGTAISARSRSCIIHRPCSLYSMRFPNRHSLNATARTSGIDGSRRTLSSRALHSLSSVVWARMVSWCTLSRPIA
mmetsp:Transcript_3837/g.12144  ORF Transcript_3837/g.12144 Transcript_3837/m.12144 type:complete len:216 (-) Transcript_3837:755-1402(-)